MRILLTISVAIAVALGASIAGGSTPIAMSTGDGSGCRALGRATPEAGAMAPLGPIRYRRDAANVELDGTVLVSNAIVVQEPVEANEVLDCTLVVRSRREARTTYELDVSGVIGSRSRNAKVEFLDRDDERWRTTAAPWIELASTTLTLPPRGVAEVPFRVVVPADPGSGGASASIDVVSRTRASGGSAAVGIETRAATVVLVRTGSGGAAKLRLHDVDAPRLSWDREAWRVRGNVDNDGTDFAIASGRVRIRSIFGNEVAALPVDASAVLPGGRTVLEEAWDRVPWLGLYRWDARVGSGAGGSVATAGGWFVALPPWWALAIALGVLLAAIAWWRRRRRGARTWDEDGEGGASDDPDPFDFDLAERQLHED